MAFNLFFSAEYLKNYSLRVIYKELKIVASIPSRSNCNLKVHYATNFTQLISHFHRVHLLLTLNMENTSMEVMGVSNTHGCLMNVL